MRSEFLKTYLTFDGTTLQVDDLNMVNKKAFTLAEVLITLGIIGIVAALTMPSLIANYKKQEYVTQLKKAVSTIEQGFRKRMADIECTDLNCGGIQEFMYPDYFESEIKKNFEIVSACPAKPECMPRDKSGNLLKYKNLGEGYAAKGLKDYSIFILKSGAIIGLQDTFCAPVKTTKAAGFDYNCAFVLIDVNGLKSPNQFGRDVFYFLLNEMGLLVPMYGEQWSLSDSGTTTGNWRNNKDYCDTPRKTSSGLGCAARLIENGWKMDY